MVNTILARRVNHIVAKRDNPAWPKGSKSRGFSRIPKCGVYVGEDSRLYPCFDSSDYAYENRRYMNLVFAKKQEELDVKMAKLKNMEQIGANYSKLTAELHPMAYWGGDTNHDVFLTEAASE